MDLCGPYSELNLRSSVWRVYTCNPEKRFSTILARLRASKRSALTQRSPGYALRLQNSATLQIVPRRSRSGPSYLTKQKVPSISRRQAICQLKKTKSGDATLHCTDPGVANGNGNL